MEIDGDTVLFECSGRTASANCGIIGLGPDLRVRDGYDGGFSLGWDDHEPRVMTPAERQELAAHMIDAWRRFAEEAK